MANTGHLIKLVFEPVLMVTIIYILAKLFHCTRVLRWRGIRFGILGMILLWAAEVVTGLTIFRGSWMPGMAFFLLMVVPYAYIRGHSDSLEVRDFSKLKNHFITGISGMVIFFILEVVKAHFFLGIIISMAEWLALIIAMSCAFSCFVYYLIYHNLFQTDDMLPILLTDLGEASAFLRGQIGVGKIIGTVFSICVCSIITEWLVITVKRIPNGISPLYLGIVFVVSLFLFIRYVRGCFPVHEYLWAKKHIRDMEKVRGQHRENLKKLEVETENTPDRIVLVIGESANRDHMKAFNPDYPVDSTPWETRMKEEKGFYLFPRSYSNFTQTAQVMEQMLTGMNQYGHESGEYFITLMDIARKAGMETWWLSNQEDNDFFSEYIANQADYRLWTEHRKGDDRQFLSMLEKLPKKGKQFIIIHLMGSHLRYEDRIPEGMHLLPTPGAGRDVRAYDTSLLYTDQLLQDMMEWNRQRAGTSAFLYVSDHAEDMVYTHGTGHMSFDMVRIPFWIYLSPEMESVNPELAAGLSANRNALFTNDLIYDTACGLMQAPNSMYVKRFDISSRSYDLKENEAMTMHGKIKICEDPMLRK
ncbi:phosphoethanolamine transferase [uncultured Dialister sp.]|uniref:phosphoethanolamine transferase n=1 Tax=uncultured Dialister sp. TaxID=278064 RepID=UPI0025D174C9|nr:phosphoethanolamine transferase [uncultured Dialister sp.]